MIFGAYTSIIFGLSHMILFFLALGRCLYDELPFFINLSCFLQGDPELCLTFSFWQSSLDSPQLTDDFLKTVVYPLLMRLFMFWKL